MADFDPDAYLAAPSGGFDPDAYLAGSKPPESLLERTTIGSEGPVTETWGQLKSGLGQAAAAFNPLSPENRAITQKASTTGFFDPSASMERGKLLAQGVGGLGQAAGSFITGPAASVGGHLIELLNAGMRAPAVALYGEDKVRQAEAAVGDKPGGGGYEAAKQTAEGLLAGIAPGRGGVSLPAPNPLEAASQRLGVPIPRVAASDNLIAQRTAGALKEIPFVGDPLVKASRAATEGLGTAAENTAAEYGHGQVITGGESAKDALVDWVGGGSKAILNRLYSRVDPLIDQTATRPLHQTADEVNKIIEQRRASGTEDTGKAVDLVTDAVTRPNGLTYQGIKDLRTRIGSYLDGSILPEPGTSMPDLKRIYGALTTDLRGTVLDHGGPDALKAFDRANTIAGQVSNRREQLAKIVGTDAGAAPERVLDRLSQMASTKASADITRLTLARKAMGPEPWNEVASGIISRIGRDVEGNFSPERFLTAYGRFSPEGKHIIFGSTGRQDLVQALDDIATISSRAKQLASYGNPSGTGRTMTTMGALGAMFAEPLTTLSSAIGGRLLAQAMARPITARSVANWMGQTVTAARSGSPPPPIPQPLQRMVIDSGRTGRPIRTLQGTLPAGAQEQNNQASGGRTDQPNGGIDQKQGFAQGGRIKEKLSHKAVGYVDKSRIPGKHCSVCSMYNGPNDCDLVRAPINAPGWCRRYKARKK